MRTNIWNSVGDNDAPDNTDVYTQPNHAQYNNLVKEPHVYQRMK